VTGGLIFNILTAASDAPKRFAPPPKHKPKRRR
jgi:hypothetical protein